MNSRCRIIIFAGDNAPMMIMMSVLAALPRVAGHSVE